MKKILLSIGIVSAVFLGSWTLSSAQVNSAVGGQSLWKMVSGALQPMISTWDIGSSASRINKIWATSADITTLTFSGVSGDLDMGGYSITNLFNLTATGTVSMTGTTTLATTTATKLTVTGQTTLATASSTALTVSGNTVLATTTATALTTTGTTNLATTTITGNLNVTGTYIPRVVSYNSASTTINVDTTDIASSTIAGPITFVNPTGTPVAGQMFEIWGTATGTQTVYWGTNFASSTDLVNVSSVATGTTKWLFEYRPTSAKWELSGLLKVFDN